MLRIAAVVAFVVVASSAARADAIAYSCRAPANVEIVRGDRGGACTGFVAKDASGRVASRASGYFISGAIFASPDGRSVAMLHSSPVSTGTFETKDALVLFRDGKQVAKYSMRDLIQRMDLVTASTSHYRWIADASSPRDDLVLGDTFELTTTSHRRYMFDVVTGKQRSADDTATWNKCDVLVYAAERIAGPSNGQYTLARAWLAKGKLPGGNGSKLTFSATADVKVADRSGVTLCLVPDAKHGWRAIEVLGVMYNLLPKPARASLSDAKWEEPDPSIPSIGAGSGSVGAGKVAIDTTRQGRFVVSAVHHDNDTSLSIDRVMAMIRSRFLGGIVRCHTAELKTGDPAAHGRMLLGFTVTATGNTKSVRVKGLSQRLDSCVERLVTTWRIEVPKDGDGSPTDAEFLVAIDLQP